MFTLSYSSYLFSDNESVVDELGEVGASVDVVEAVSGSKQLVVGIVHDRRVESVKTHEVRHLSVRL